MWHLTSKKSLTADGNLKVKQLMVEEGDTVNVGDVLYTVDNTDCDAKPSAGGSFSRYGESEHDSAKNGQNQQSIYRRKVP